MILNANQQTRVSYKAVLIKNMSLQKIFHERGKSLFLFSCHKVCASLISNKFIDKKKYLKLSVILVVRINNLQTTGCYMLTTVNNYLLTSMF